MLVFSLVACESNENTEIEDNEYESPYVEDYDFPVAIMNDVYYYCHDIFAGFYIVDGSYHVNITEDASELIIAELSQNSLVTHHIVTYSFAELWSTKEIVFYAVKDLDGFSSLGVSEEDNFVVLTLITDTVVPPAIYRYIELGILVIDYTDLLSVAT